MLLLLHYEATRSQFIGKMNSMLYSAWEDFKNLWLSVLRHENKNSMKFSKADAER